MGGGVDVIEELKLLGKFKKKIGGGGGVRVHKKKNSGGGGGGRVGGGGVRVDVNDELKFL